MTKPTPSPPIISCGKEELKLLRYMNSINRRLNIKEYSRVSNKPRSTIYGYLERLIIKGLVNKPYPSSFLITQKGQDFLDVLGGVETVRGECRKGANLSTHYLKYKLKIKDKSKFNTEFIKDLNPEEYKVNKLTNLEQHIIKFSDATIVINPKQVIISIHDLITEDIDDSQIKSLNLALKYVNKLEKINIITEGMMLEDGHYARVNSYLSGFLEKIDHRYVLKLDNGRLFWIDHSNGKREDETNDINIRERLDSFLDDAINSESLISDIDKMKEVVGTLVRLRTLDLKITQQQTKLMQDNTFLDEKDNYFG